MGWAVCTVHCAVTSVRYAVFRVQFAVQCAVIIVQCAGGSGQGVVCSVQCFLLCSVLKCRVLPGCGIVDPYVGYEMTWKPTEGDRDKGHLPKLDETKNCYLF